MIRQRVSMPGMFSPRHWLFAGVLALVIHAGAAYAMLHADAPVKRSNPGQGAIRISLGIAAVEAEQVDEAEPDLPEPELPPVTEQVEPIPPEPLPELEPVEQVDLSVEPPEPAPMPVAKPVLRPPRPQPTKQAEHKPEAVASAASTRMAEQSQMADTGHAGARADYLTRLQLYLEQHKQYPRSARMRRQEGIAELYVLMDRNGRILSARLESGSGYKALDDEAMAMLRRAAPLPAMPDSMTQERLELIIPVRFALR